MREPYHITINQYRNTVTLPNIEFVTNDYMTCSLVFKIMKDDLQAYDLTRKKVYLVVKTPSGKSIQELCVVNDAEAGICNILLPQDLILEQGLHQAELQVIDAENNIVRMTSPKFSYNVRLSLQNDNTEEAKNQLSQLQEALQTVADIDVDAKIETHNLAEDSHEDIRNSLGDISTLKTDDKTNLTSAINEVKTQSNQIATKQDEHQVESVQQVGGVHGLKIERFAGSSLEYLNGWEERTPIQLKKIDKTAFVQFDLGGGVLTKGTKIVKLPTTFIPVGSLDVNFICIGMSNAQYVKNQIFKITWDGYLAIGNHEDLVKTYEYIGSLVYETNN